MRAWLAAAWAWVCDWAATAREAVEDYALLGWFAFTELCWWLHEESERTPWVSWLCHFVLAIPCAYLGTWVYAACRWLGLDERVSVAVACATSTFAYRELEQGFHAHVLNGIALTRKLLIDRPMDVVAATFGALVWFRWIV